MDTDSTDVVDTTGATRNSKLAIVGDDGSEGGQRASEWARSLADATGIELVVIGVTETDEASSVDALRDDLEHRVCEPTRSGGLSCECRTAIGDARAVLIDEADDVGAGLMIVGDTGHWGVLRPPMGSVASHLTHHGNRPVVVVPASGGPIADGTIVVGLDGSPDSIHALEWATTFARQTRAKIIAVLVQPALADTFATAAAESDWRLPEEREVKRLVERAARPGVDIELRTVYANRVQGLLDTAASADASLIAVASRGKGGFQRLLLGGTATQLLHHSDRPVAVIPAEPATA